MTSWFEQHLTRFWNRIAARPKPRVVRALDLGVRVADGESTSERVAIPLGRRAEHVAVLGKTGTGKSSLLRYLAKQDVGSGRGFVYFDLHGDATPYLVRAIAEQERAGREDLSKKLLVIDPADSEFSVGLNPLEVSDANNRFVQIAEFAAVLKQRWHLESFGARTDELLRNALYALAENGFTLLELGPFLGHAAFRAQCLKQVQNPEIRQYFESRYDNASDAMRAVMREPILNKTSAFTADPRFRHIVGQTKSTFSIRAAMDEGSWILLNLHKGKLGEQAATLGSLFLTVVKNALFARERRDLFTLYCDEIQNLVSYGGGLETILSEARKFGVSVTSANQYLEQYPPEMRSAILAVGSQIFFQLSSPDAQQVANALDGGKPLAELLKHLPRRHMVVKTGHERWQETRVPEVDEPKIDPAELLKRSRDRSARKRSEVEEEISRRQATVNQTSKEALHEWE